MAKGKFNHELENVFDAVGLPEKETVEGIKNVLDSFNESDNKSPSTMTEHLEKGFSKRQLAFVASQALHSARQLENELNLVKQAVLAGLGGEEETQG